MSTMSTDLRGTGIALDQMDEREPIELIEEDDWLMELRIYNQAGYDFTRADVLMLLRWLKANRPGVLAQAGLVVTPDPSIP